MLWNFFSIAQILIYILYKGKCTCWWELYENVTYIFYGIKIGKTLSKASSKFVSNSKMIYSIWHITWNKTTH